MTHQVKFVRQAGVLVIAFTLVQLGCGDESGPPNDGDDADGRADAQDVVDACADADGGTVGRACSATDPCPCGEQCMRLNPSNAEPTLCYPIGRPRCDCATDCATAPGASCYAAGFVLFTGSGLCLTEAEMQALCRRADGGVFGCSGGILLGQDCV